MKSLYQYHPQKVKEVTENIAACNALYGSEWWRHNAEDAMVDCVISYEEFRDILEYMRQMSHGY